MLLQATAKQDELNCLVTDQALAELPSSWFELSTVDLILAEMSIAWLDSGWTIYILDDLTVAELSYILQYSPLITSHTRGIIHMAPCDAYRGKLKSKLKS